MSNELKKTYFNYNALDKTTSATLRTEATAIKAAVKRTHDNIIEIGNRLIHAKEVAGHGKFMEWIDAEFGMGRTMAENFINAAKAFSNSHFSGNLNLSQTALFALSSPSVSDETREVALELAASGDLKTTADAKVLIEAAKPPKNDLSAPKDNELYPPEPEPQTAPIEVPDDEDFDAADPFADEDEDEPDEAIKTEGTEAQSELELVPPGIGALAPSLEDQIEALPMARALSLFGHGGHIFKRDALFCLTHAEPFAKIAHKIQGDVRHAKGQRIEIWRAAIQGNDPTKWEGCPACKGSLRFGERHDPCAACNQTGYTTRKNEGVSADVVRDYAESLRDA